MADSATDFVRRSLRLLNVISMVEDPEPEDLANGLDVLNEMMDAWGTQRRLVYYIAPNRWPLVSGQASYTIGIGGNFNQVRPQTIPRWSVIPDRSVTPIVEVPHGRPLTLSEWQRIGAKSIQGSFPSVIYYDRNWAAGLAKIWVYPVPNNSSCDLVLYTPTPLTTFPDATTQYTFPPGFRRAIRYNLAVELADDYPGGMPPGVQEKAVDSLAWIKRANFELKEAEFDSAIIGSRGRRYNMYTDS